MDTKPYTKDTDNCPVQPLWNHVAGVPIQRASIGPPEVSSLPGLDDLMAAVLRSRGPWINIDPVNRFLTLHGLNFGDLVDCVDGEGNVELRFVVELEGLDLIWVTERRSVWLVNVCASVGEPANGRPPPSDGTQARTISFDERLRLAFEALSSAESMANAIHEHRQPDNPEGVPKELVEPILSTIAALEDAIAIRPQGTWPLSYFDLSSVANDVRRGDSFAASVHLNNTLMGYLDNSLYSGMSVEEYTLALQVLFWGTRLLVVIGLDWDFGLLEEDFRWAGVLWFQDCLESEVSLKAFLNNSFTRRLDPHIHSLLLRVATTNQTADWTHLRIAVNARLDYSRSCGDALRQLLLLWAIDNNMVGIGATVYH